MPNSHLITSRVKGRTCGRCRAPILYGHDEGIPVRVDTAPLPRLARAAALLTGRSVYTLTSSGYLVRHTGQRPPVGQVVTDHVCGQPLARAQASEAYRQADTEQPPF